MINLKYNMARVGISLMIMLIGLGSIRIYGQGDFYLFSFFKDNGEDGLHLAYSEDGFTWQALNQNKSFLTPTAGKDKLMRDPCIIRGRDRLFHMVWTVSWNEPGIGYASSADLIHWSEQRYLPVMEHEPLTRNCWAPEVFYDDDEDLYLIFWSSTIPGRFPETDSSGDNGYNHRMYFVTTKDFQEFSETKLFYNQGFNVIDGTLQKIGNNYFLFLKDETKNPEAEKNIRIATSAHLTGPYSAASNPISDHWVEGPTSIEIDDQWVIYFDMYTRHQMGAISSADLIEWRNVSDYIHFPKGTRHGTVLKIDQKTLENLKKVAN
ncbi:MAG: glycoside hydrolase family 43 protein [Saprospiraceae bacterium]|nr:glycoside hydrolase family 43 protein [Saprospiraceae bacterium]